MLRETPAKRGIILSMLPATADERRNALLVVFVSIAVFLVCAPNAKMPLPQVWAFLPAYQSALVIVDLITAVLLFGQFSILRSRALLALASGYLFSALMAIAHALSFPGLFAESGLLQSGPQTTAWLYFLWHGGFPLFVIAYARLKDDQSAPSAAQRSARWAILTSIGAVLGAASALTLLTTAGHDGLPVIMRGDLDDSAKIMVAAATWMLSLAALPVLWWRRPHSVLDVWLMVVVCVWIFDVALASVLNHGRFDLGWYAGRIYGLSAMSIVLLVLLTENTLLHARVVEAHEREFRAHLRAEEKAAELAAANKDLEAFSYSVSHDLRAPLRSIDGFSRALLEDCSDRLDAIGRKHLTRILNAVERMGELIDDLLNLARISRTDLQVRENVDLAPMVRTIANSLMEGDPNRNAEFLIADDARVQGDPRLLQIVLENLLGNAWKFTAGRSPALIEFFQTSVDGVPAYCVRDNGAGFDMRQAARLFAPFQRLHNASEFPGTGIGLATVQRIIQKHAGRVWAESEVGRGAAFFFALASSHPEAAAHPPAAKLRAAGDTTRAPEPVTS
jgi:signal transduction histidine kinase